jgi:DNA topoisomerase I
MARPAQATTSRTIRAGKLRYVDVTDPGIRRVRSGKGFRYLGPSGRVVRDPRALKRIRALAVPPAWENVWICSHARGHIQAVGTDVRGRKQYLYHSQWRQSRDEAKYGQMLAFARRLPRIRRTVARHLRQKHLSRDKVLAAVVRLLESSLIRVGNEEYANQNGSYGLTTMHDRHARVNGAKVTFRFPGKGGIPHAIGLNDPLLAKIVRRCQQLPGQQLFQFLDEAGQVQDVKSTDVNDYLRRITGEEFTAKDFRTWSGTALAVRALRELGDFDSDAAAKRNIAQALEKVAERLGNTKAICRKCYVHPAIIDAYLDRSLTRKLRSKSKAGRGPLAKLPPAEAAVLRLLQTPVNHQGNGKASRPKKKR